MPGWERFSSFPESLQTFATRSRYVHRKEYSVQKLTYLTYFVVYRVVPLTLISPNARSSVSRQGQREHLLPDHLGDTLI